MTFFSFLYSAIGVLGEGMKQFSPGYVWKESKVPAVKVLLRNTEPFLAAYSRAKTHT